MTASDTVAAYSFRQLAWGVQSASVSRCKAARAAIKRRDLGELREGTEEWVQRDEIKADDTWRRRPTGCGELS